jgi:electron transport complex protein RnfG
MNKFKDSLVGGVVILLSLCLVSAALLSFAKNITADLIEGHKGQEPDLGSEIAAELLPEGVSSAYLSGDGILTVRATAKGFGGAVEFIVEIDRDGNYLSIILGENSETDGVGSNVGDEEYLKQYYGHRDPQSIDALSGATRTSAALKEALEVCNQVFDSLKGV